MKERKHKGKTIRLRSERVNKQTEIDKKQKEKQRRKRERERGRYSEGDNNI
jgi:hypothetical protein